MSDYLRKFLEGEKKPVNETKSFNSVEGLIKSMVPLQPPSQDKPVTLSPEAKKALEEANMLIEQVQEYAKKALKTPGDKKLEKVVDKQIEKDLNESFSHQEQINESYDFYRDKNETFECIVSVEGSTLKNAVARLSLVTDVFNVFFEGKVYADGRCVIPVKKLTIFPSGTTGTAKLEIIIEDTIFVPWEQKFKVKADNQKVTVKVQPKS